VRYFLVVIALLLPLTSEAQLTAPGMSAVRYTLYPSAPAVKDPVFIYCNTTGSQKGALTANSPGGTGPFNYSWYQWSDVTKSFSDFIKTESAVLTSSLTNLPEGGYKVIISGGFNTSLAGWIFIVLICSSFLATSTCIDSILFNVKRIICLANVRSFF